MKTSFPPVFHVEEKPGADVLVVAFTGIAQRFNSIPPFDFFDLTGVLRYHRILLRDPTRSCYLKGVDETGLEGLMERIRAEIRRLSPRRVLFMGVSSGGYAALLLGCLLGADYVHAFAPHTHLDAPQLIRNNWRHFSQWLLIPSGLRLNLLPAPVRRYLDLRPVLMKARDPQPQFYLHAGAHSLDRARAEHLQGCPGARVFLYPCSHHHVVWGLIKNQYLFELLREENLDSADQVYRRFYGDFDPDQGAHAGFLIEGAKI